MPRRLALPVILLLAAAAPAADPPSVADALKAITAVGREGAGNEAAAAGWKALTAAGPAALLPTLAAFDGAGPAAQNWLRSAVDAIAERQKQAKQPLPADELASFLRDAARDPAARRIAYELLLAQDKAAAEAILPTLVDDPSTELRRDAVAARLSAPGERTRAELESLFAASRDKDQAEDIAKKLRAAGGKPDLTRQFSFVTEWRVVGPFDGPGGSGFAKSYPPEMGLEFAAKYPGKGETEAAWKPAQSDATYGTIDLNAEIGKHKHAVAYAAAVLVADKETPAEVRVNSPNAVVLFLNGKKLYQHEEYHHGDRMDQYVGRGTLRAGRNELLVKVVQNDQTEAWAQKWQFAARVCDRTGGPLPLKQIVSRDGKDETTTPGALKPAVKKEEKK